MFVWQNVLFELEHFRYVFLSRKIKNFQICGSCRSAINLGQQITNPQIAKKYWVRKSENCPACGRSEQCNKFCKSTNLRIFRGLGEGDSWKYLKQKICLWHCPFKAKHQRTQECIDVSSQNFIKILSLATIPLKSNNSIYKITTPSYRLKEDICRRMPRKFFS